MCPGYRGTFQPKRESKKRGGTPGDGAANTKLLILPEFTPIKPTNQPSNPNTPEEKEKKKTTEQKKTSKPAKLWMGTF